MNQINSEFKKIKKTFNDYIKELPPYIGLEIFKFIIHDIESIKFTNSKYQIAFLDGKQMINKKGAFLCRISKNNGKYRYYLTSEHKAYYCYTCAERYSLIDYLSEFQIASEICCNWCEMIINNASLYYNKYKSKYVGKDINKALLELYL
jgi:hypothetical protein